MSISVEGRYAPVLKSGTDAVVRPLKVTDGGARGTLTPNKNNNNNGVRLQLHRTFVFPNRHKFGGAARQSGSARVFIAIAPALSDESAPAITSEDIGHEHEISKRNAESANRRTSLRPGSRRVSRRRRIRQEGSRYIEKLDHRVLLFEIPIVK